MLKIITGITAGLLAGFGTGFGILMLIAKVM